VALEVARQLGAEVEEIGSLDSRSGIIGYLRSGREAVLGDAARIRPPEIDPRGYDVVVIATPVWAMSLASPARAYVATQAPRMHRVAFVVTLGGMGAERVLAQLQEVAGQQPLATLVVREKDVADAPARASAFAGELRARLAALPVTAAAGPPRDKAA
jgi:hypothetical protein